MFDVSAAAVVAILVFLAGVIFQSGRLTERVDTNTKDIDALARAVRELTHDVTAMLRRDSEETPS